MERVSAGHRGAAVCARSPGRIVQKADFERLLATRPRGRSAHFAIHHVAAASPVPAPAFAGGGDTTLSTPPAPPCPQPVDDLPDSVRVGCIVPKRHARRAVTRNLIKRQLRAAFAARAGGLASGLWLARLVAPYPRGEFVSAASPALRRAVRTEIDALLRRFSAA